MKNARKLRRKAIGNGIKEVGIDVDERVPLVPTGSAKARKTLIDIMERTGFSAG